MRRDVELQATYGPRFVAWAVFGSVGRALLIALFASACAVAPRVLTDPSTARYELREWPRGSVTVTVEAGRPGQIGDFDRLSRTVKTIVTAALATAHGPSGPPEELKIVIRDHDVFLRNRFWRSHTRLGAELTRNGRLLTSWEALGEDRRWDRRAHMLPSFDDAEDSLHRSFERALHELVTQLARRPPP